MIVQELLEGNINHLIGVLSPLVIKNWKHLSELRKLSMDNLSQKCYPSIHGMARQNYKKYVETGNDASEKRCNMVCRILNFGILLLKQKKVEFNPVKGCKPSDIPILMDKLDDAFMESILPEEPKKSEELLEWLFKIRMEELEYR